MFQVLGAVMIICGGMGIGYNYAEKERKKIEKGCARATANRDVYRRGRTACC